MKKAIYILLTIFLFPFLLSAQTFSISGVITDLSSGKPIQGAVVFLSQNVIEYSSGSGSYFLRGLKKGEYTLRISGLGYKSKVEKIVLKENIILNFSLEESNIELNEIIVTTDRNEKYLRNTPFSEILIDKSKIELHPGITVSDILKDEPGVALLRDGAWGTEISIRGMNRENLVTLIDGSRIVTSTDIAARMSLVNPSDIEKIEVIKGASSSIYGSGATGGIVNIITRNTGFTESFSLGGSVSAGYGSVNGLKSFSGSLLAGNPFIATRISGSYRKAGNTKTPSGTLNNSMFEDYGFTGNLNVLPLDNHQIKLNYQLFKAEDVGIPGASVFPDKAEVRYPFERREMISAGYEIKNLTDYLYKISLNYSNQFIQRDVENIPNQVQMIPASGSTPARRVSVLKITPGADHKNNNLQLRANFSPGYNNFLVTGIDYWDRVYNGGRNKYQKIETLNTQGDVISTTNKIIFEKPLPDSKYKSIGFFAQNDAGLIPEKLVLVTGMRIDKIFIEGSETLNPVYEIVNGKVNQKPVGQKIIWKSSEAENTSFSANAGLKLSADENTDLTLSLGYSFRSPSLEERFQYIDQGSEIRIGNPDLNPEKGLSADLGLRYYSSSFKLITSVFFSSYTDLVSEIPGLVEDRKAQIKTNIGEARLYGFDFRTDYNFYDKHIAYLSASFVKGDDITSDGNLPEIAPLNGILGIKYKVSSTVSAELSAVIFAPQNDNAAKELATPGYAYFNLSSEFGPFDLHGIRLKVSAGVENIFDRAYRNHLSTTRGSILTEPGRNIFLNLVTSW